MAKVGADQTRDRSN